MGLYIIWFRVFLWNHACKLQEDVEIIDANACEERHGPRGQAERLAAPRGAHDAEEGPECDVGQVEPPSRLRPEHCVNERQHLLGGATRRPKKIPQDGREALEGGHVRRRHAAGGEHRVDERQEPGGAVGPEQEAPAATGTAKSV